MSEWWETPCVQGSRLGKNGYAQLPGGHRGRRLSAHRAAWEAEHGPIPDGHHIHHRCENKACINVQHLELHTPRSHYAQHRRCDHDERYIRPNGRTRCRTCEREWRREYEARRYHTDPDYRAAKIARSIAYKRRKREGVET